MKQILLNLYPFLFALYPILFMYEHNIRKVPLPHLLTGLAFAVIVYIITFPLTYLSTRHPGKRRLLHSIVLTIFFLYGRLYKHIFFKGIVPSNLYDILYPIMILLIIASFFLLFFKIKKWNNTVEQAGICIGCLLCFFCVKGIVKYHMKKPIPVSHAKKDPFPALKGSYQPDIYHIILDEYGCNYVMKKTFDYDNSPFENTLREKGFFLPKLSVGPFHWTKKCIPSILNMNLINKGESPYDLIEHNKVQKLLEDYGYKTFFIGNEYNVGKWRAARGTYVNYFDSKLRRYVFNSFMLKLYRSTCLHKILTRGHASLQNHENFEKSFQYVESIPNSVKGPKYVFFHLLSPHRPFIFGPNGEKLPPTQSENWSDKSIYLGQFQYVSKRTLTLLERIFQNSPEPPVIILQSDHGPRFLKNGRIQYKPFYEVDFTLNAWYMPEGHPIDLPVRLETVNTYRRLFNHLFETKLPLLPKRKFRVKPSILVEEVPMDEIKSTDRRAKTP